MPKAQQLYHAIAAFTTGEAHELLKTVEESNGVEGWRKLTLEYDPQVKERQNKLLGGILRREFGSQKVEFLLNEIAVFEKDVGLYQAWAKSKLEDHLLHSILLNGIQNVALEEYLGRHPEIIHSYEARKRDITRFASLRRPVGAPIIAMWSAERDYDGVVRAVLSSGQGPSQGGGEAQPPGPMRLSKIA